MSRTARLVAASVAALSLVACADQASTAASSTDLSSAFITVPVGFESNLSSFAGTGEGFAPGDFERGRGPGADFMGGGLGADFLGGSFDGGRLFDDHGGRGHDGRGPGGAPGNETCTYAAATGVNTCTSTTRDGLTVTRTVSYKTAAGTAQQTRDTLTSTIVEHVVVSGTATRRDSVKSTVNHVSDRTTTGAAKASTQRTVNGASKGTEASSGKNRDGLAFTSLRTVGDTTRGLVIPVSAGKTTYPTAGTVIRAMTAATTVSGTTTNSSRREVIVYDGSATAKLTITENGTTKTCTVPLPHGRPVCS